MLIENSTWKFSLEAKSDIKSKEHGSRLGENNCSAFVAVQCHLLVHVMAAAHDKEKIENYINIKNSSKSYFRRFSPPPPSSHTWYEALAHTKLQQTHMLSHRRRFPPKKSRNSKLVELTLYGVSKNVNDVKHFLCRLPYLTGIGSWLLLVGEKGKGFRESGGCCRYRCRVISFDMATSKKNKILALFPISKSA